MELSDLITKHYMTREEEDMQNRDNAEELGWSGGAFASIIHDFMSECTGKLRGRGQKCVSISTNHISKKSPRLLVLAVDGMTLEAIWSNKEFKVPPLFLFAML